MKHEDAMGTMAAERYVLGELHDAEREQFEEHFFDCPECAQDVRDLSTLAAGTRQLLTEPQRKEAPKQRAAPSGRWQWLWPIPNFALAGALALVTFLCGYEALLLRAPMRAQVLASLVLRPDTRSGDRATNPVTKTGPLLPPLAVYLDGSAGKLEWDFRRDGSEKPIFRETADSPKPRELFEVSLPSSDLTPGDYILSFHSADSPSGKSWIFRINLAPGGR